MPRREFTSSAASPRATPSQGNRIGTNATGLRPLFQAGSTLIQQVGVLINQAPGLDLQDVNPGAWQHDRRRDLRSGQPDLRQCRRDPDQPGPNPRATSSLGNLIGPASNGGGGAGNTVGVYINGSPGNIIGGGLGNVISGNSSVGVYILGSPSTGQPDHRQHHRPEARRQAASAQPEWHLHRKCPGESSSAGPRRPPAT